MLFILRLLNTTYAPGEGNGNPLQYSCLENPMDGGAWWATVHRSQTVRHDWATSFSLSCPAWLFQYPNTGHVFAQLQPGLSAPVQIVRLAHALNIALPNVGGPHLISWRLEQNKTSCVLEQEIILPQTDLRLYLHCRFSWGQVTSPPCRFGACWHL